MKIEHPTFNYSDCQWKRTNQSYLIQYYEELKDYLKKHILLLDRIEVIRALNKCIQYIKDHSKLGIPNNRIFEELRKYKVEWFEYIVSDDRTIRYYFQTKVIDNEPIEREKELKNLIFKDSKQKVFSDFTGPNGTIDVKGRLFVKYAINWFLSRYDLQTAARINAIFKKNYRKVVIENSSNILKVCNKITIFLRNIFQKEKKDGNGKNPKEIQVSFLQIILRGYSLIFMFLILIFAFIVRPLIFKPDWGWRFPLKIKWHSLLFHPSSLFESDIYNFFPYINFLKILILLAFLIFLINIIFRILLTKEFLTYKLFLPRLIGGIILGYIPLIMTQEIWEWLFRFNYHTLIILNLLSIIFSYVYLFLEVYNNLDNIQEAAKRSCSVLILGLIYSLIIGVFLFDLFTPILISDLNKSTMYKPFLVQGLFGYYDPLRLLSYFPVALTIGIFLQIFWEEKPITHPI